MRRMLFAVPVLASMAALPAEAEMFGPGFQPCGDQTSTLAVVECVQAKTNVADQRLNAAYKALQARREEHEHWAERNLRRPDTTPDRNLPHALSALPGLWRVGEGR